MVVVVVVVIVTIIEIYGPCNIHIEKGFLFAILINVVCPHEKRETEREISWIKNRIYIYEKKCIIFIGCTYLYRGGGQPLLK